MKNLIENCNDCRSRLPDLLLDPAALSQETKSSMDLHVAECGACRQEIADLRRTFELMDEWTAPEPSAFFDTRLHARLRESQAAQPEGFFERIRSFFLFSTGRQLRPALAGALALVLVVSGASFVGIHGLHSGNGVYASPTVDDLRILDNNAQALQQMDQLLDDSNDDDAPST